MTGPLTVFLSTPGTACLVPNGVYKAAGQIHLVGAMNMTLEGQGATILHPVRGNSPIFLIDGGGSTVKLRNVRVWGANPAPGKWTYAYEHEHCVAIGGTIHVELDRLSCINVGGDGLYLGGGANRWADDVWVHDSIFDGIGRMGVAMTDGISNLRVERSTWRNIGYYLWDVEPNGVQVGGRLAGVQTAKFLDNVIGPHPYGTYPQDPTQADGWAMVSTGASGGGFCDDVEAARNVISDPAWPIFRTANFLGCTRWSMHDNVKP